MLARKGLGLSSPEPVWPSRHPVTGTSANWVPMGALGICSSRAMEAALCPPSLPSQQATSLALWEPLLASPQVFLELIVKNGGLAGRSGT